MASLLHHWKFLVRYWIFRSSHAEARRTRRWKYPLHIGCFCLPAIMRIAGVEFQISNLKSTTEHLTLHENKDGREKRKWLSELLTSLLDIPCSILDIRFRFFRGSFFPQVLRLMVPKSGKVLKRKPVQFSTGYQRSARHNENCCRKPVAFDLDALAG